jgi:hypothetical protein
MMMMTVMYVFFIQDCQTVDISQYSCAKQQVKEKKEKKKKPKENHRTKIFTFYL